MITRIDLLRHGKVAGPPALYGRTDVAVSDEGEQQLWQAVRNLSPQQVITSPLQRCRVFAHHYAQSQQLPCRIESDLQEVDFGRWDGVPFDDLYAEPEQWQGVEAYFREPGIHSPPDGESLAQSHQRVALCWQRLQEQLHGQHSLVVCHGGVIRLLLANLLPVDWRDGRWFSALDIGYASLTRIEIADMADATPVVRFIGLPANALN